MANKNVAFGLILCALCIIAGILPWVNAWPYQMYQNGTIVDLNESNNQSTNLTIYVLNVTNLNITYGNNITNISAFYYNTTNITNVTTNITNYTGGNYTFYNITNITAYFNQSNGSYYNKTEIDNLMASFLLKSNSYVKEELYTQAEVNSKLDALNVSLTEQIEDAKKNNGGSHIWLWICIIIVFAVGVFSLWQWKKMSGGDYDEEER